jgi:Flp pilus assembly protein TadD
MAVPGNSQKTEPNWTALRGLLATCRPSALLARVGENSDLAGVDETVILRARALLELERYRDAEQALASKLDKFQGSIQDEALCLWAEIALRLGRVDSAVQTALHVSQESQQAEWQAVGLSLVAVGFARKLCWTSAELALQQALEIAPTDSRLLAAQARVRLDGDQRITARTIYERLRLQPDLWGKIVGAWGVSYVSYLMGEFDQAWDIGMSGLDLSPEAILPVYVLAQISLARNDLTQAEWMLELLQQRSPYADGLSILKGDVDLLRQRLLNRSQDGKRLVAFPTLVQRREYCGPSTVELVLRYWETSPKINNDQIADWVKIPQSGSPIYKIREFFQLLGYETIRTLLPSAKLKSLIDLGIPAIIQEAYSNTSHVAVVIGYDNGTRQFEIQDPMTHTVQAIGEQELQRLRKVYLESGLVAYPRRRGLRDKLAALDIFDHPALVWTDQAVMEMDQGRFIPAIDLLQRAVQRTSTHPFSWILLLYALLEIWRNSIYQEYPGAGDGILTVLDEATGKVLQIRKLFYSYLNQAKAVFPHEGFIYQLAGQAKLLEGNFTRALAFLKRAAVMDDQNPRIHAALAECYFLLRNPSKSLDASNRCLEIDPANPAGNAWMARSRVVLGKEQALYFARAAVELSSDWWLTHLALAEAWIECGNYEFALHELELARDLSPNESDVESQFAYLAYLRGEGQQFLGILHDLQQKGNHFPPVVQYRIGKNLCQLAFDQQEFSKAVQHAQSLAQSFPQDPWAMQFLAAVTCEYYLDVESSLDEEHLGSVRALYEQAIRVNQGHPEVVASYLNYLTVFRGVQLSLEVLADLAEEYPDENNPYRFIQGGLLAQAGSTALAAEVMLQTLHQPSVIQQRAELDQAMKIIVEGLGPEEAVYAVLNRSKSRNNFQGVPVQECERSLGLILASDTESRDLARDILGKVIQRDPQDAEVLLRLGDVSASDVDREAHYRQAVFLKPQWILAREILAKFLLEKGRFDEALELTVGYEQASRVIHFVIARVLFAKGLFENSAQVLYEVLENQNEPGEEVLLALWQAETQSGQFSTAYSVAQKGLHIFKKDPLWFFRAALSLVELGRFDQAESAYRKAVFLGLPVSERLRYQYHVSFHQQDYARAFDDLNQMESEVSSTEQDPKLTWIEKEMLKLVSLMGDGEMISQILQSKNLDAYGWGNAAAAVLQGGLSELAVELARKSLTLDGSNLTGMSALGQAWYEIGNYPESFAVFQQMRSIHANHHKAYEFLALQAALKESFTEAYELADRSVNLGAACSLTWAVRGLVSFLLQRAEDASSDLYIARNRMDFIERSRRCVYWAVLAYLQQKTKDAQNWWRQAQNGGGDRVLISLIAPYFSEIDRYSV